MARHSNGRRYLTRRDEAFRYKCIGADDEGGLVADKCAR